MLFNSYIFILLFLPVCLIIYYFLGNLQSEIPQKISLIGMSMLFYGYFNVYYLLVFIGSILVNFIMNHMIQSIRNQKLKKCIFISVLLLNLGVLFVFKYQNFFVENINILFEKNIEKLGLVLPLGISFYTFQQIAYQIDTYKKSKYVCKNLIDYMLFVSFFPQLIAGPIVSWNEMRQQIIYINKKVNWKNIASGLYLFSLGLLKKVILADTFGKAVSYGFGNIELLNGINAIIVIFSYTFEIYFDFSAYSDMAIALAKMFNFELPLNFKSPYKAFSISDFWNRWHITLTRFLTQYIYIPLGGNRQGKIRTSLNILIVFLISGLWHGANWTFVAWGSIYGILMVLEKNKILNGKCPKVIKWIFTFSIINLLWVLFRAASFAECLQMIYRIGIWDGQGILADLNSAFSLYEITWFIRYVLKCEAIISYINSVGLYAIGYIVVGFILIWQKSAYEFFEKFKPTLGTMLVTIFALFWSICSLSNVSRFLYFNF